MRYKLKLTGANPGADEACSFLLPKPLANYFNNDLENVAVYAKGRKIPILLSAGGVFLFRSNDLPKNLEIEIGIGSQKRDGNLRNGLVSSYLFNGDLKDGTGSNDGTMLGNASYTTGKIGQGIHTTGNSGSLVELANPTAFHLTTYSMAVWGRNWVDFSGVGNMVYQAGLIGIFLERNSNTSIRFLSCNASRTDSVGQVFNFDENWFHYVITYTPTTANCYTNGSHVETDTSLAAPSYISTATMRFGQKTTTCKAGDFDRFLYFDRVLTAAEVKQLYDEGNNLFSVESWWVATNTNFFLYLPKGVPYEIKASPGAFIRWGVSEPTMLQAVIAHAQAEATSQASEIRAEEAECTGTSGNLRATENVVAETVGQVRANEGWKVFVTGESRANELASHPTDAAIPHTEQIASPFMAQARSEISTPAPFEAHIFQGTMLGRIQTENHIQENVAQAMPASGQARANEEWLSPTNGKVVDTLQSQALAQAQTRWALKIPTGSTPAIWEKEQQAAAILGETRQTEKRELPTRAQAADALNKPFSNLAGVRETSANLMSSAAYLRAYEKEGFSKTAAIFALCQISTPSSASVWYTLNQASPTMAGSRWEATVTAISRAMIRGFLQENAPASGKVHAQTQQELSALGATWDSLQTKLGQDSQVWYNNPGIYSAQATITERVMAILDTFIEHINTTRSMTLGETAYLRFLTKEYSEASETWSLTAPEDVSVVVEYGDGSFREVATAIQESTGTYRVSVYIDPSEFSQGETVYIRFAWMKGALEKYFREKLRVGG